MSSTDEQIQHRIAEQFRKHAELDARDILVKVADGVIELAGYVRNQTEKNLAVTIVRSVPGVSALSDDLQLKLPDCDTGTDPEIARSVARMLRTPGNEGVKAIVHDRVVSLEGTIGTANERLEMERLIWNVTGVLGIENHVKVVGGVSADRVRGRIEEEFRLRADLDARGVLLDVQGDRITLRGRVASEAERAAALRAAQATPGVASVTDELVVAQDPPDA